ncbi:TrbI/VirB10 family protein [Dethiosulfovibrio sp. F2B]|uniref:TrbI/VirB10 family protein n=1 Tax=Dethiosulfovibrio faecalis TaxID=2720018 RepID=UPI001F351FB8|nr:TrbI/VirB10 family protein [Dethiosulfovibrio faecalis]MCF4150694.1 TrbI/VirB10 family protein [Dethiosulfovibrio faecalis]
MNERIKVFLAVAAIFLICSVAWASDEAPVFKQLDDMEKIVYGEVGTGGLIDRLNRVEKTLFGRELPGTVAERQAALARFVREGTDTQPSLLFKMSIAEWITEQVSTPEKPIVDRIGALERKLEGQPMEDGPLAMRLERMLGLLVSEPVLWSSVPVPAGTVVRVSLLDTISPSSVSVGDTVKGKLTRDLVVGNVLVAPKGSLVEGAVSSVSKPRSFGRPAEVRFLFERLITPSPNWISLSVGEAANEAAKAEKAQIAAVGSSLAGAILLGPLGLAGGFLVRGDVKEIPAGSIFHMEVSEETPVLSYPVPEGLVSLIQVPVDRLSQDIEPAASEVDNL